MLVTPKVRIVFIQIFIPGPNSLLRLRVGARVIHVENGYFDSSTDMRLALNGEKMVKQQRRNGGIQF